MGWLRLFVTDYLVGFLFLTGLFAWLVVDRATKDPRRFRGLATAVVAAAFVIAIPGLFAVSHVLHVSLSQGRWWRFLAIAAAGLPLFISDESVIRRLHPRWKADGVFILIRVLFLSFVVTGALVFNRENGFLVLIAPLIVGFWILLWFAAGVVHRRTQNPLAAALFAALVQGWAFAAWFVTT